MKVKKIILTATLSTLIMFSFFLPTSVYADTAQGTTFRITKTGTPSTVGPNGTVNYTISIENIGQANASPQVVRDTLPAGFTYLGNSQLTTVQNTQLAFAPVASGQTLTWTFDGTSLQSIPTGDNIVISYAVRAAQALGTYTNTACITQPENICANYTVTVATSPAAGIIGASVLSIGIGLFGLGIYTQKKRKASTFEASLIQ